MILFISLLIIFFTVAPRNTSIGPRSKRAVTANPSLMTRPNVAAKGLKPAGPAQGMVNGRAASMNVVNRYFVYIDSHLEMKGKKYKHCKFKF